MQRETFARGVAALGAGLGGIALALQFVLIVRQIGAPWLAAWRFVGFFTILSNLLVAFVLFRAAVRRPCSRRLELSCATAIVMVGLVYSLLLRATWSPQGAQKLADVALHDVAPVVFLLYFLTRPRPALSLSDALAALVFPLGYVVYALARGVADGWYAYWFLDPSRLGAGQMALSVIALAAAFFAAALALTWLSNALNAATARANALSRSG